MPSKLRIERPSKYFSEATLQDFFEEQLPDEVKSHLRSANDAIWVLTMSTSLPKGSNYCFAIIGLTEAAPAGRSARVPAVTYSSATLSDTVGALNDEQRNSCISQALKSAASTFAKVPLAELLEGIEKTRDQGPGKVKSEPADPTMVRVFSSMVSEAGKNRVFEAIPSEFRAAFDYRKLQWVVLARSYTFDQQQVAVCVALAGVAANAPKERNPRFPGAWWIVTREISLAESGEENAERVQIDCRDDLALNAVKNAVATSWDDKGLLEDYSSALETGVPRVSNYKRPDPAIAAAREATKFRSSLAVGSDTHCGLVIEVRRPIAKVQSMIGEVWLKVDQLYPKGTRDCRFVNGTYQD
ncbi:hypothetical protein F0U62_47910 [Cystobacter fuscus]|uniref:hypothetical protein n=1 Tax=Cystobacter fuscus TaxID=43 RepID=UPI002B299F2F|nr:hypothetical protein F0U62_47910 [Cystobacter fuscus]